MGLDTEIALVMIWGGLGVIVAVMAGYAIRGAVEWVRGRRR